jgi:hypothetical protein
MFSKTFLPRGKSFREGMGNGLLFGSTEDKATMKANLDRKKIQL